MATLQLTAQRKSDALAVLNNTNVIFLYNEYANKASLKASLTAAGDTDNMTCSVAELELLKAKIPAYKPGLTEEQLTNVEELEVAVQASIDA